MRKTLEVLHTHTHTHTCLSDKKEIGSSRAPGGARLRARAWPLGRAVMRAGAGSERSSRDRVGVGVGQKAGLMDCRTPQGQFHPSIERRVWGGLGKGKVHCLAHLDRPSAGSCLRSAMAIREQVFLGREKAPTLGGLSVGTVRN